MRPHPHGKRQRGVRHAINKVEVGTFGGLLVAQRCEVPCSVVPPSPLSECYGDRPPSGARKEFGTDALVRVKPSKRLLPPTVVIVECQIYLIARPGRSNLAAAAARIRRPRPRRSAMRLRLTYLRSYRPLAPGPDMIVLDRSRHRWRHGIVQAITIPGPERDRRNGKGRHLRRSAPQGPRAL